MSPVRPAAARGLLLLSALLMGAVTAQTAPAAKPATPATPAERRISAPAPLSTAETTALRALYQKLRPATLRIEDCPPNDCREPDGVGTAFLIGDGYALTAYHVVFGSKNLSAQTLDKKRYRVQVVGYDDQADIALLKVNVPAGTPSMPLAAKRPVIGDSVLAIGNGGGDFLTPKTGRLTGLDSDAGRADFPAGTLEMNAQLIPGDSGGPIINARGEVEGVVSYIRTDSRGRDITAYAVPITKTDPRLQALRRGLKRDAPVIGVSIGGDFALLTALPAEAFPELSRVLSLGDTPGAFFTSVVPGSPAARAGLQPLDFDQDGKRVAGDLVTAVNGQRVVNFSDFQFAVRRYEPGQTVTLSVLRGGKKLELKLTLISRAQVRNN